MIKAMIFTAETVSQEGIRDILEYYHKRYKLVFCGKLREKEFKHYFNVFLPRINYDTLEKELGVKKNEVIILSSRIKHNIIRNLVYKNPEQTKKDLLQLDPDNQFLHPKTFRCTQCGECCRPIVKVSEHDIKRIEELGLSRTEFLSPDPLRNNSEKKDTLKQINGVCMFLKRTEGRFYCSIYDHRPHNCQIYPFVKNKLELKECVPHYLTPQPPLMKIIKKE